MMKKGDLIGFEDSGDTLIALRDFSTVDMQHEYEADLEKLTAYESLGFRGWLLEKGYAELPDRIMFMRNIGDAIYFSISEPYKPEVTDG